MDTEVPYEVAILNNFDALWSKAERTIKAKGDYSLELYQVSKERGEVAWVLETRGHRFPEFEPRTKGSKRNPVKIKINTPQPSLQSALEVFIGCAELYQPIPKKSPRPHGWSRILTIRDLRPYYQDPERFRGFLAGCPYIASMSLLKPFGTQPTITGTQALLFEILTGRHNPQLLIPLLYSPPDRKKCSLQLTNSCLPPSAAHVTLLLNSLTSYTGKDEYREHILTTLNPLLQASNWIQICQLSTGPALKQLHEKIKPLDDLQYREGLYACLTVDNPHGMEFILQFHKPSLKDKASLLSYVLTSQTKHALTLLSELGIDIAKGIKEQADHIASNPKSYSSQLGQESILKFERFKRIFAEYTHPPHPVIPEDALTSTIDLL